MKLNFIISPFFDISLLDVSSLPTGTSFKAMLGIEFKIVSNSFFIFDCSAIYYEICSEIFLDFSNKLGSLDFDISFFSFSRVSLL